MGGKELIIWAYKVKGSNKVRIRVEGPIRLGWWWGESSVIWSSGGIKEVTTFDLLGKGSNKMRTGLEGAMK